MRASVDNAQNRANASASGYTSNQQERAPPEHRKFGRQRLFKATGALEFEEEPIQTEIRVDREIDDNQKQIRERLLRSGCTRSGLPSWAGVFVTGRPDGIIIEGVKWADRRKMPSPSQKSRVIFHLFEFTRTSEAYFPQSRQKKIDQHKEICEALTARGWRWQLHILQMGCRGFMPVETKATLMSLGASRRLNSTKFAQLYKSKYTHHPISIPNGTSS